MTPQPKRLPPVWLMGLLNAPIGISGALALLTLPQLLAANHVPEPEIAKITGLALVPTFAGFLVSPMLDVWLKRRTWAFLLTTLSSVFTALSLLSVGHPEWLGVLLFVALFGAGMNGGAVGGWLGSLVSKADEARLGAWMIVGSISGFGLTSIIGITVFRALPLPFSAILLGALVSISSLILPLVPCPPPDGKLAHESFGEFFRDIFALIRRREVVATLVLFCMPCAAFALTNTLGGLGRDFSASEQFVALIGGIGTTVAGLVGSLLVPPLAARLPRLPLYLGVGAVGAVFTLALILAPHTPTSFLVAMIGENVFQSAAFALGNAIVFHTVGKDNPLAATQFTLLTAAYSLPVTYMQVLDGHAYGVARLPGLFGIDGGLGLLACAAMALMLVVLRRSRPV